MRITATALSLALSLCINAWAQDAKTPDQLAKESEDACAASASKKATPDEVKAHVAEACKLIEKDGAKAFSAFKGKDSKFIFGGTYITVTDYEGTTLMHPIKYKMEGKSTLDTKDSNGKAFFIEYIDTAKNKGEGWVSYQWPKPGEKTPSSKVAFVKRVKCDGKDALVGCGIYDVPEAEITKLTGQ